MKILFFDTETTGLPRDKRVLAKDQEGNWPDIVSMAWMILDENKKLLKAKYCLVKPEGWIIPEDSIAIHGITQSQAEAEGVLLRPLLEEFQRDVLSCKYIVAHNLKFDKNVIDNAALWRAGRAPIRWMTCFCTAEIGKDLTRIPFPDGRGFKYPRLAELYTFLTRKLPSVELHNALFDTTLLAELFYHLPLAKILLSKNEGSNSNPSVLSIRLTDPS
jgi:DNA polymerase-3 subunit alpha